MRWWSIKTLRNTQGSETCRCIYMQVEGWLQACQSLSDKVQILSVFLLSLYSSLLVYVPVLLCHSQDTHWGTVMSQFHWLVSLCLIFFGEWRSETYSTVQDSKNSWRTYEEKETGWCFCGSVRTLLCCKLGSDQQTSFIHMLHLCFFIRC